MSLEIEELINNPNRVHDYWQEFLDALSLTKDQEFSETVLKEKLRKIVLIAPYFAFPGKEIVNEIKVLILNGNLSKALEATQAIIRCINTPGSNVIKIKTDLKRFLKRAESTKIDIKPQGFHYFEIIMLGIFSQMFKKHLKRAFKVCIDVVSDGFIYDVIFVKEAHKYANAILLNPNIKVCFIYDMFLDRDHFYKNFYLDNLEDNTRVDKTICWALISRKLRFEVGLYYLASTDPVKKANDLEKYFDIVFPHTENPMEIHLQILNGIKNRFQAPFFEALRTYTHLPKSTFHALPIARAKSIIKSIWMQDMIQFYGYRIFFAESSATSGGLDSLLNPTGSLKLALEKASRYFGSMHTFFVTDGTSASNRIVSTALTQPGDIVLLERTAHESHHLNLVCSGVNVIYLPGVQLPEYDIVGPVDIDTIKKTLLELKDKGLLHKVKMLVLTNCTFDGLVYNPRLVMRELLAIKPDLIFFWDEAWFSFARCVTHYRSRTAMEAAKNLYQEIHSNTGKCPLDPYKTKIRVYCTQSMHKSLSCLRQGSLIHIYDEEFDKHNFSNAAYAHLTTSPNYQILATMDLARRQADLEGYYLVQSAIELAMIVREQINSSSTINKYFQALGPSELIAEKHRLSGVASGYPGISIWEKILDAWTNDEFTIDPTRVTILCKSSLLSGHELKQLFMDKFGIQFNKNSYNTILIQFNIGTTEGSSAILIKSLVEMSHYLDSLPPAKKIHPPHLPGPITFFPKFRNIDFNSVIIRDVYFEGRDNFYYLTLHTPIKSDVHVCATFLFPTPPGYPILVPGQVITEEIMEILKRTDKNSILGLDIKKGIKCIKLKNQPALDNKSKKRSKDSKK